MKEQLPRPTPAPTSQELDARIQELVYENGRALAREQAKGRKALPRTSSGKHPSKIVMM